MVMGALIILQFWLRYLNFDFQFYGFFQLFWRFWSFHLSLNIFCQFVEILISYPTWKFFWSFEFYGEIHNNISTLSQIICISIAQLFSNNFFNYDFYWSRTKRSIEVYKEWGFFSLSILQVFFCCAINSGYWGEWWG